MIYFLIKENIFMRNILKMSYKIPSNFFIILHLKILMSGKKFWIPLYFVNEDIPN